MCSTRGDLYLYLNCITCLKWLSLSHSLFSARWTVDSHLHFGSWREKSVGMAPGLSDLVKLLDAIDLEVTLFKAILFEVLQTRMWIFGQRRPSNSLNPSSSYCRIIQKLVKTNFRILFPIFSLDTTLKSNAMLHFEANLLRAWESSNHLTSSPQRTLRADENGDCRKLKLVLKAPFERQKRKI